MLSVAIAVLSLLSLFIWRGFAAVRDYSLTWTLAQAVLTGLIAAVGRVFGVWSKNEEQPLRAVRGLHGSSRRLLDLKPACCFADVDARSLRMLPEEEK